MSYEFVGQITDETLCDLIDLSQDCEWKIVKDEEKDFHTCFIEPDLVELKERWPDIASAFFLKIPPGGRVHRHTDTDDKETYHVVVMTNQECVSYMSNGQVEAYRLQAGDIYSVDRSIAHWSENYGQTDRIHLLVECGK